MDKGVVMKKHQRLAVVTMYKIWRVWNKSKNIEDSMERAEYLAIQLLKPSVRLQKLAEIQKEKTNLGRVMAYATKSI